MPLITIGIVGENARAEEHARALARFPGDQVAIIRCHPSDLDQLLQRAEIQVVDLCVGIPRQTELGIQVARAGKHVIAALPIANSLAELDTLTSTCQSAGIRLIVTGTGEYSGLVHALDNALASGQIGTPVALRLVWLEPANRVPVEPNDDELVYQIAQPLFIAHHIFGLRAESVYAQHPNNVGQDNHPSRYVHLMLTFAGNATAVLEVGVSPDNHTFRMLSLLGSHGAAYHVQPEQGVVLAQDHSHLIEAPNLPDSAREWQAIIESLQHEAQGASNVQAPVQALVNCLTATTAARLSHERNTVVRTAQLVQEDSLS